jgi:uncharacterized protein (TIRG00374 family)
VSAIEVDPQGSPQVAAGDLDVPEELSRRSLRKRLALLVGLVAVVALAITLLPGLAELRTRLSHAQPGWLLVGVGLKVLSGLGYVAVFRMVFCRRMSWRVSYQIGMSELGANALFPTGGAGGLALGAWALKRGGMPAAEIARRTVAFFLLTSVANVAGVILIGTGLALRLFPGETNLALTALPAAVAALAVVASVLAGRAAPRLHRSLRRKQREGSSRASRLLTQTLVALADGVNEALALLREANPWLIGGIIAYLVFDVMVLWATFRAFGSAPPLAVVWIGYLIGELGGLIPIPGGIGGVDAGLVGTLVLYGVQVTPAASAVIAYRAIALWVPAVLGSLAFVSLRRTLRRESELIAVCSPQTEIEVIGRGRVMIGGPVEVSRHVG